MNFILGGRVKHIKNKMVISVDIYEKQCLLLLLLLAVVTGHCALPTSTILSARSTISTDSSITTAHITGMVGGSRIIQGTFTRITTYQRRLFCHICATR